MCSWIVTVKKSTLVKLLCILQEPSQRHQVKVLEEGSEVQVEGGKTVVEGMGGRKDGDEGPAIRSA